ncbi:MAG: S8 family serine peptidase, partial [Planctomycetota bacterium]
SLSYPASSQYVTAVTSVDASGSFSKFAQRSPGVLAAPGESISSSVPDHVLGWDGIVDDIVPATGTSMAAPQVTAAAVAVRGALSHAGIDPTPELIADVLQQTGSTTNDIGSAALIVDTDSAIAAILNGEFGQPQPPTLGDHGGMENDLNNGSAGLPGWIEQQDDGLMVNGTQRGDHVTLDLRDGLLVSRNGTALRLTHDLGSLSNDRITLIGAGDADELRLIGSADEISKVILQGETHVGSLRLPRLGIEIQYNGFESVSYVSGNAADRIALYDSAGDDTLTARPGTTTLRGTGFDLQVENSPRIFIGASTGNDVARLYDSDGDDVLAIRPQFTSLRQTDSSYFVTARNFDRVNVYAGLGFDSATLYDSVGDDRFSASGFASTVAGPGYYASARGFESVDAIANSGGNDIANLYAADSQVQWQRHANLLRLEFTDSAVVRQAQGFEIAHPHGVEGIVHLETLGSLRQMETLHAIDELVQENASDRRHAMLSYLSALGIDASPDATREC